jgi:glycosyltransferase involved in cell wall biosynthesis
MRILQVVTLISPDGAYGGPVRVAFNQTRQLRSQGHEVLVAGAYRGYGAVPRELDGVAVQLTRPRAIVPFMGFAGLASPGLLWWMLRGLSRYDVVHIHLARDLVTLPAAVLALVMRKRLVVQTHGMIIPSRRAVAPLMDRLLTRPVLRRANVVLHLSEEEKRALLQVEPRLTLRQLPNGVPMYDVTTEHEDTASSDQIEVLYLARLHERKRPRLFVEAAADLLSEGIDARFRLVGPDGGEAENVENAIATAHDPWARIAWQGALPPDETVERMRRASFYVLPSVNEPFPMSVLEAMAVGLPLILTESCGLADVVKSSGSGIIVDESKRGLVDAMRSLIVDPLLRKKMGIAAQRTAGELFSMDAVGRQLLGIYAAEPVGPPN